MDAINTKPKARSASSLRIALVDDSEAVRRSLSLLLRASGLDVVCFDSGAAAQDDPTLGEADCLLIDFKMTGLDGLKLLSKLRKRGVTAPAILISGVVTGGLTEKAAAAGYTAFVRKPMTQADLLDGIRAALA
jgi:two-component system, LuxR family, response regulator FixJ